MKNVRTYLFLAVVIALGAYLIIKTSPKSVNNDLISPQTSVTKQTTAEEKTVDELSSSGDAGKAGDGSQVVPPLERASERTTKKKFGQFVTPQNSPVQPERFRGYHTGLDFEVFASELSQEVEIRAICTGKLIVKRSASGYGGVAVQSCAIGGNQVTVIYGHLKLASILKKAGEEIEKGESLGILGADKSSETDGERKHLHLGIHKGKAINILGYVQNKADLLQWIDPCKYFCSQ